jgi:hypothetical protein
MQRRDISLCFCQSLIPTARVKPKVVGEVKREGWSYDREFLESIVAGNPK